MEGQRGKALMFSDNRSNGGVSLRSNFHMPDPVAKVLGPVFVMACLAAHLRAEDWPQWRGPYRTGHVANGARVPGALTTQPRAVWRIEVSEGLASPVVAGGKVFYFDNQAGKETLHAISANDAKELWRAAVDDVFADEQG